ncbi:MAG: peptide deformylase [Patescibacteria group bacterium]
MILKLQTGKDNQILRKKSQSIAEINQEIFNLIKDMQETMKKDNGVGLSACQIGKNIQLFVINNDYSHKCVFINPEIIKLSKKTEMVEEGCLSLPGMFIPVKRSLSLKIKAMDENGKEFKIKAKDMLARAIQHEYDHLNGVLICDNAKQN